jgi:hypothetical protein
MFLAEVGAYEEVIEAKGYSITVHIVGALCSVRNSSRDLPLNNSSAPFFHGLPGAMRSAFDAEANDRSGGEDECERQQHA